MNYFRSYMIFSRQAGASMLEYSMILAMILLIILGSMRFMGESVSQQFSEVGSTLVSE